MNKRIWKYRLSLCEAQSFDVPFEFNVLCVQEQDAAICCWAEVSGEDAYQTATFTIVGTGHTVPMMAGKYIGTVQQGPYVWHVYLSISLKVKP